MVGGVCKVLRIKKNVVKLEMEIMKKMQNE